MKTIRKIIISAIAIIPFLFVASCQKDNTLYYNNLTMGNIVDGRFISDQGNVFNVVEQTCAGKIDTMTRALVICDVLNQTPGTDKEYDIRLNHLTSVLTKNPLAAADATEGDASVKDPIHIEDLWFSGGYLNMYVAIPFDAEKNVKHLVNLVYEKDGDGNIVLELRHNAFSDLRDDQNPDCVLGGSYISFPIVDTIGTDSAKLIIKWKWYDKVNDYAYTSTEKEYSIEYEWKREGFEQTSNPTY